MIQDWIVRWVLTKVGGKVYNAGETKEAIQYMSSEIRGLTGCQMLVI